MEPNKSRSLDWKTCFKKILAPELLNPLNDEEQNNAPHLSNPSNDEEQNNASQPSNKSDREENDACQIIVNAKNTICTTDSLNNLESAQKNVNSSISVQSVDADDGSKSFTYGLNQCQSSDLTYGEQNNSENPNETEESIESIISADAKLLARSFKSLKVRKKDKFYFNKAENSRNPPNWNIAFKKVLDPNYVSESSLKFPEEFVDKKPDSSHPELLDSWETNRWTYHRLCKDERLENTEVQAQPSRENCNKNIQYTKKEKEALEMLKSARSFKPPKKPSINIFDGAGVNCFKDSKNKSVAKNRSSNTKKPNNIPPPGGWVCVKPLTLEEIRNRPPNIIFSECWDWDEDI